jgi:hypothetical protein
VLATSPLPGKPAGREGKRIKKAAKVITDLSSPFSTKLFPIPTWVYLTDYSEVLNLLIQDFNLPVD